MASVVPRATEERKLFWLFQMKSARNPLPTGSTSTSIKKAGFILLDKHKLEEDFARLLEDRLKEAKRIDPKEVVEIFLNMPISVIQEKEQE